MTFTHALSTNNYGPAKFVVATSAANGTHTTLASAMTAASSGDTIFLRNSVTENVTITPGVNIVSNLGSDNTPTVSITGKITMSGAGSSTIAGIQLITNSDFCVVVSGNSASILYLDNCYINCLNNTGISYSSSSSSSQVNLSFCDGDVATTGISLYSMSSTGTMNITEGYFTNSGASTSISSNSAGRVFIRSAYFLFPLSTSSTGGIYIQNSIIDSSSQNVISLTANGSGNGTVNETFFLSGTASAISIGATLNVSLCNVSSSNTNAITGTGTINNSGVSFIGTSSKINTTTIAAFNFGVGGISFDGGTNVMSAYTVGTFTPTLVGTVTGTTTYTNQFGYYVRIGELVQIQGAVQGSAATGTGNVVLGAFPFTIKNQSLGLALGSMDSGSSGWAWPASTTMLSPYGNANAPNGSITASGSSNAGSNLQMTNATFSFIYNIVHEI